MASVRVLRFPRGDRHSAHVLVNVSSTGPKPLDLKLTATEGDDPYACVLKHDAVSSLRAKNCPVSEEEWEHILLALLQREPVEDIQVAAAVQPETSVSLTFRKQVQGITQRLGAITLQCDQSEQIELFQWCDWSLDALDKHRKEAADSIAKARRMEAEVTDLRAQLDELLQAKQDDEASLLLKFRDLLNEKKVKIREQQKIIAASSEDSAFSQPQEAGDDRAAHRPASSRPAKRKAATENVVGEPQDDGDQAMEDAAVKSEPGDTEPGSPSDDTASVGDDQDHDGPPESGATRDVEPGQPRSTTGIRGRQEAPQKTTRAPPPRRSLPFANKQSNTQPSRDAETESDDEL